MNNKTDQELRLLMQSGKAETRVIYTTIDNHYLNIVFLKAHLLLKNETKAAELTDMVFSKFGDLLHHKPTIMKITNLKLFLTEELLPKAYKRLQHIP